MHHPRGTRLLVLAVFSTAVLKQVYSQNDVYRDVARHIVPVYHTAESIEKLFEAIVCSTSESGE
jgi:hypothetical protein